MISEAHRIYEEAHDRADAATQRRMIAEAELARARNDEQAALEVLAIWAPVSLATIHAGCTNENDSAPGCATAWLRDHPPLASCGHPRNEDGECDCASWPERAPYTGYLGEHGDTPDPRDPLSFAAHTAAALDKIAPR